MNNQNLIVFGGLGLLVAGVILYEFRSGGVQGSSTLPPDPIPVGTTISVYQPDGTLFAEYIITGSHEILVTQPPTWDYDIVGTNGATQTLTRQQLEADISNYPSGWRVVVQVA